MTKLSKTLDKMRRNPQDWRIEHLKTLASTHGVDYRQPGTSHVTFRHPNGAKLTVPAHRPIKAVYITKFLRLLLEGQGE